MIYLKTIHLRWPQPVRLSREALGPKLLGQRGRKRQPPVTGDLPWRAVGPIARPRQGGPSHVLGASRRSIPFGETEKGETAGPAPQTIGAAERWLTALPALISPRRIPSND